MEQAVKKAAVVTGASSGIGLEISRTLCGLGYEVFGIGRDFENPVFRETAAAEGWPELKQENIPAGNDTENEKTGTFHRLVCDVTDTQKLCAAVREITAVFPVYVLVHSAGVGYYGLHEELNPRKIQEMVRVNLEAPMILTQQLLRELKKNKGWVIHISSVTAGQANPHGCAYGATKAGLAGFSRSLFEEARKYGVKSVSICPDMTQTQLYRNADFMEGEEPESYLLPREVAEAVEFILTRRDGMVVTEIMLRPQLHRIRKKKTV